MDSNKRKIEKDGEIYLRVKKEKPKSRAQRRDEILYDLEEKQSGIQNAIQVLENFMAETEDLRIRIEEAQALGNEEEMEDFQNELSKKMEDMQSQIEDAIGISVGEALSEVEYLQEEMENWRDNFPENLQGSEKYEVVSNSAENLAMAADALNSFTELLDLDDLENTLSALEENETYLSEAISYLSEAEFPGLYG